MNGTLRLFPESDANIWPTLEQPLKIKYSNNAYYLFNLSGGRRKIKILLSDILLVRSIKGGHNDKLLFLKDGTVHKIRGHSHDELILITGFLIQCSKQDLVSPAAVNYLEDDTIFLVNTLTENGKSIFISLNRTYKKSFLDFFRYSQ